MSASVVLPLGCGPLPRTPKSTFSSVMKTQTDALNHCLDDVFQEELVLYSSPSPPKRRQPLIPVVLPCNGTPSRSACHILWKKRPKPKVPVEILGEEIDSPSAVQFIRKTPIGQGSPKFLSVSPAGGSESPLMKRWQRQSSGLLLEEDEDWDEKKVAPARDLWLKARRMIRQAGLNPRNLTLVQPCREEHVEQCNVPRKKDLRRANTVREEDAEQCNVSRKRELKRANTDSLVTGGRCPALALVGGDEDSSNASVPKDALSKLLDDQHKIQSLGESQARDHFPSRPSSQASSCRPMPEASTKSSLENSKVRRARMAALGAASLWKKKPNSV